jgi:hypothetical protein
MGFFSRFQLKSCTIVSNRQDACSTKNGFSCGVGILPARKRLIENGGRSQFQPTSAMRRGIDSLLGLVGECKNSGGLVSDCGFYLK